MKNIIKYTFGFSLFFSSILGMEGSLDGMMQQMVLSTAAIALNKPLSHIISLTKIEESDITHISYYAGPNCKTYSGSLPDGSSINADRFHNGPLKGQTHCQLSVYHDGFVMIPLNAKYYKIMKQKFKNQNT